MVIERYSQIYQVKWVEVFFFSIKGGTQTLIVEALKTTFLFRNVLINTQINRTFWIIIIVESNFLGYYCPDWTFENSSKDWILCVIR